MQPRWLATLRRAAALPAPERDDLARAFAAVAGARLRTWTRPTGRLVGAGAADAPGEPTAAQLERAAELARAVDRAGMAFRATCLVRALALHRLLAAEGLRGASLRLGVLPAGGKLRAHAWVELAGARLGNDGRRAHGFAPLGAGASPVGVGGAR
ncbi:MAG TPA: lasso peptide biosynthesis B2 protein [Longimicrobium sp.]|nr:lasso peptide biosynthesis B2 protein [Longimicrobium sp.]